MGRRKTTDRTPRQRFLARVCAEYGATWADIAAALGVSSSTVQRWASGEESGVVNEALVEMALREDGR